MMDAAASTYHARALRELVRLAVKRGSATAEDLRRRIPLPPGLHPNAVGAVFLCALQRGLLRRRGHARATWGAANAHHFRRWAPTRDAEAWLAHTPEIAGERYPEQAELFGREGGVS